MFYYKKGDIVRTEPWIRPTSELFELWLNEWSKLDGIDIYDVYLTGAFCQNYFLNKNLDTWDIEATPDETNVVSVDDSTGDIFYPYSNTEYWSPDSRSFPIESAATSIFISEYPNFHDKCLAEINFDSFDGVTIRDSSGNGCKGIVFGDFSIKKEKKGQPTQRDSSIDTPKIAKDDKKAF